MTPKILRPSTDQELRAMRDAVYPAMQPNQIQTNESWENCKPKWREDEEWLTAEYGKLKAAQVRTF